MNSREAPANDSGGVHLAHRCDARNIVLNRICSRGKAETQPRHARDKVVEDAASGQVSGRSYSVRAEVHAARSEPQTITRGAVEGEVDSSVRLRTIQGVTRYVDFLAVMQRDPMT